MALFSLDSFNSLGNGPAAYNQLADHPLHGHMSTMWESKSQGEMQRRDMVARSYHNSLDQQIASRRELHRHDLSRERKEGIGTSLTGLGDPHQRVQITASVRANNMWNPPAPPPQRRAGRGPTFASPRPSFGQQPSFAPNFGSGGGGGFGGGFGGGGGFQPRPPGQAKSDVFQQHLDAQIHQKRTRLAPGMAPQPEESGPFGMPSPRNRGGRRVGTPPGGYPYFGGGGGEGGGGRSGMPSTFSHNELAPMSQTFPPAQRSMPTSQLPAYSSRRADPMERSVPRGDVPLMAQTNLPDELGSPLLLQLNGLYDDLRAQRGHRMEQRWQASVVAEKQFDERYNAMGPQ